MKYNDASPIKNNNLYSLALGKMSKKGIINFFYPLPAKMCTHLKAAHWDYKLERRHLKNAKAHY